MLAAFMSRPGELLGRAGIAVTEKGIQYDEKNGPS